MAAKIPLTITLADGTVHDIVANDKDIIALEERFDIDAGMLQHRRRMIWMAFLAWTVLHDKGIITEDFDTWKKSAFAVDGKEEVPEGNA